MNDEIKINAEALLNAGLTANGFEALMAMAGCIDVGEGGVSLADEEIRASSGIDEKSYLEGVDNLKKQGVIKCSDHRARYWVNRKFAFRPCIVVPMVRSAA